jgi:hypothetical protein
MNERGQAPGGSPELDDEGLRDLRERLDALQRSVEQLGTESPPPQARQRPARGLQPPAPAAAARRAEPAADGRHQYVRPRPAASARASVLDVGPFADLVELHRFEQAVAALPAVRDLRVRRFGRGRARIDVVVEGSHSIGRELIRLGTPMRFEPRTAEELIVHLPEPDAAPDGRRDGAAAAETLRGRGR